MKKLMLIIAVLFVAGCSDGGIEAKTGAGGDIIIVNGGEDVKSPIIDNSDTTDNSVTNPAPEVTE